MISRTNEDSEPSYARDGSNLEEVTIHSQAPFYCQYGGVLPNLNITYESWGELNNEKNNTILVQHGLSANPHARSHNV